MKSPRTTDSHLTRWKSLAAMVSRMAGVSDPPAVEHHESLEHQAPIDELPIPAKVPVPLPPPITMPASENVVPSEPVQEEPALTARERSPAPAPSNGTVEPPAERAQTRARTPVEKNPPISIFAIDYDFETAESFFKGLSWQRHGPDQPIPDPARKESLSLGALPVREYFQNIIPWAGRPEGQSEAALADRTALLQAATVSALQKAKQGKRVRQQSVSEWFASLPWSRS